MAMSGDHPPARGSDEPGIDGKAAPLLVDGATELRDRWDHAQSTFVDDPRQAVQQAGALVEDVLERLARTFDDERTRLEEAWATGAEPSTEDLRQSLHRYREFFGRLLSA